MAWRPRKYLIEGELDNTTPGQVTGWLRFAGMDGLVTLELNGNFHRDIRGAKIRLNGPDNEDNQKARSYMSEFAPMQTGNAGDITAGKPPRDYVDHPYIEWYSEQNGRVLLELQPQQLEVIGRPIPACESDPISRSQQALLMARFLADVSLETGTPAIALGHGIVSDPSFSHWVVVEGSIIGEARSVEQHNGCCFAYVRLFACPEMAELGSIEQKHLLPKNQA